MQVYASEKYAATLGHLGTPVPVAEWGGFLLRRPTLYGRDDLVGGYPVTVMSKNADLPRAFSRLAEAGFVNCTMVLDPLSEIDPVLAQRHFDHWRPFKTHFLQDNRLGAPQLSKHHRYYVRRAQQEVDVQVICLRDYLDAWNDLYESLAARHQIAADACFPADAFAQLADIDDIVTFGAFKGGELVASHIWAADARCAFSHLAASNETGYSVGAAYALNDLALSHFRSVDVLNFGGVAGSVDDTANGLARFKKGFSNRTASSILCGKILDADCYAEYCALADAEACSDYFPAYRSATAVTLKQGQIAG